MAEVINLRMARKARDRREKAQIASANRAKFGATAQDKALLDADRQRTARQLDGHRLDQHGEDA
ncbi:MAG: hypothetical protein RLZZ08_634 [Pseudomonadota bacterium]|jgi:hypothetical protein